MAANAGSAAAASGANAGLVPLQATQLSHAAAIAAATNQFYEYQVKVIAESSHFIQFFCRCGGRNDVERDWILAIMS